MVETSLLLLSFIVELSVGMDFVDEEEPVQCVKAREIS
jgi:hypothetical protein